MKKLDGLTREHLQFAATKIDNEGIPKDHVWSQYYIVINGKEYPFRYTLLLAYSQISNDDLDAQSNEYYRNFIQDEFGFPIKYYKEGYNFFTKEELGYFQSIAGTEFRKTNPHQKFYGQKLYPLMEKANYWAKRIAEGDYKLIKSTNWLSSYSAEVSEYFWPRIYKGEDKDIFFNVEVNADGWIGYKFHWYFLTLKKLSDEKLEMLEDYKQTMSWSWPKINFHDLHKYDWDSLVAETKAYVKRFEPHHDHLKTVLSKQEKLCRLTWNTNNWVKPSGRVGKSKSESYEKDNGFGHEEWLFDGSKVIDGYKYGFLEPIHRGRNKRIGSVFDLNLFTRNAQDKKDYWVTCLNDVEVISRDEATRIQEFYEKSGWFDEMKADLFNLNLPTKKLEKWIKKDRSALFNVKFRANELNKLTGNLIAFDMAEEVPSHHYVLMDVGLSLKYKYGKKSLSGFDFDNSGSSVAELKAKGTRQNSGKEIEVELKHNLLQEKFLLYLQREFGQGNVKRECSAFGASRIDITQKTATGYIFYEIKTFNCLITSIRHALGQLLEYSMFPEVNHAEKLVLVSHVPPNDLAVKYIKHLRTALNLPFNYIYFDHEREEILATV